MVVIHDLPHPPVIVATSTERAAVPAEPEHELPPADVPSPRADGAGRHQLVDHSWLGFAERVLQSWPITVRLAVLVLVLITGTAALAAAVGVVGQLALAGLGLRAHWLRRQRQRAMQPGATEPEDTQ
jgi:hypothetical protein